MTYQIRGSHNSEFIIGEVFFCYGNKEGIFELVNANTDDTVEPYVDTTFEGFIHVRKKNYNEEII